MHDPDHELIELSRDGDKRAFGKLVDRYYEMVFVVAFGVLHNHEAAKDVAQEVFFKVFQDLESFKGQSKFKTWLYRVAMNAAIDAARKVRRHEPLDMTDSSDDDERRPMVIADNKPSARHQVMQSEMNALVRQSLDDLSPEHRAVLFLREWQDMSYEEIAETLGIEIGTVMSRLHYARKKLSEVLLLKLQNRG